MTKHELVATIQLYYVFWSYSLLHVITYKKIISRFRRFVPGNTLPLKIALTSNNLFRYACRTLCLLSLFYFSPLREVYVYLNLPLLERYNLNCRDKQIFFFPYTGYKVSLSREKNPQDYIFWIYTEIDLYTANSAFRRLTHINFR